MPSVLNTHYKAMPRYFKEFMQSASRYGQPFTKKWNNSLGVTNFHCLSIFRRHTSCGKSCLLSWGNT